MADEDPLSPRPDVPLGRRLQRRAHVWRPPTDAIETDDAYVIVVEVAGMRGSEFAVTFERQILWVRGTRSDVGGVRAYHQMEIPYGDFETGVQVNAPVDDTAIEASYSDGFLRVILPKAHPKRIPVGPTD